MECYSSDRGDTEGKFSDSMLSKIFLTALLCGGAELHCGDLFSPPRPPPNAFHLWPMETDWKDEWENYVLFQIHWSAYPSQSPMRQKEHLSLESQTLSLYLPIKGKIVENMIKSEFQTWSCRRSHFSALVSFLWNVEVRFWRKLFFQLQLSVILKAPRFLLQMGQKTGWTEGSMESKLLLW